MLTGAAGTICRPGGFCDVYRLRQSRQASSITSPAALSPTVRIYSHLSGITPYLRLDMAVDSYSAANRVGPDRKELAVLCLDGETRVRRGPAWTGRR